jgi:hypothetical protein
MAVDTQEELKPKPRRQKGPTDAERQAMADQTAAEKRRELEASGDFVDPLRQENEIGEPLTDVPDYAPVDIEAESDPAYLAMLETAVDLFGDDMIPGAKEKAVERIEEIRSGRRSYTPPPSAFITVRGGGKYLPAKYRIVWLRAEAASRGWSIQSQMLEHVMGTFKPSPGRGRDPYKVEGGFALFKAHVLNDKGFTIGEGHAVEWSDNFADYVEKAETSAIARALATAGFGTEFAIDFDEGWIADSPIRPGGGLAPFSGESGMSQPVPSVSQPDINITSSAATNILQGGRQTNATSAQIEAIKSYANTLNLTPEQLATFIVTVLGEGPQPDASVPEIIEYLGNLSFADCGRIVKGLFDAANGEA